MTKQQEEEFEQAMIRRFSGYGIRVYVAAIIDDRFRVVLRIPRGSLFGFKGRDFMAALVTASKFILRNTVNEDGKLLFANIKMTERIATVDFSESRYLRSTFDCNFDKNVKSFKVQID